MTIGSILLATALLCLVGVYVFRPILAPTRYVSPASQKERLLGQKDALLHAIKALDFDFETGQSPEAVYRRERYQLIQQAAEMLRQIDQLPDGADGVEAQIEAAIAALRGIGPAVKSTDASHASQPSACPQCRIQISQNDKFCRNCGEKLA